MFYVEKKIFSVQDQEIFSLISGDFNSIHLDKIKSRKSIFGNVIVHGINLVITSLNYLKKNSKKVLFSKLKADFLKPVYLGYISTFKLTITKNLFEIEIYQNKIKTTNITGSFLNKNIKVSNSSIKGYRKISNDTKLDVLKQYYQHLNSNKLACEISELVMTSKIIGMIEPGELSLFSSIELIKNRSNLGKYGYLKKINEILSIGLVNQKLVTNSFIISLKAFRLQKPIYQKSIKSYYGRIPKTLFLNQSSIVIGGSRGLGEITTKCLLVGGSIVSFTFNQGLKDAKRLINDLHNNGYKANKLKLDIINTKKMTGVFKKEKFDNLFYFASPKIIGNISKEIDSTIFKKMCTFYAINFYKIAREFILNGGTYIFYPSTYFLNNHNQKFKEYILAKKMGESSCDLLKDEFPNVKIFYPRLKSVLTDQTQNLLFKEHIKNTDFEFIDKIIKSKNNKNF